MDNELRKNAVRVAARHGHAEALRVNEEHDANQEEERKLHEHNDATGEQRGLAVAFISRGEQALHHGLVRPVARHGEESTAEDAGPESVALGEAEGEIEDAQLSSRGCGDLGNFPPAAGNFVQKQEKGRSRSRKVEQELDDVCPNDSAHPAFEGVKEREKRDDENRDAVAGPEGDANNFANGRDANPFGQRSRGHEHSRCNGF